MPVTSDARPKPKKSKKGEFESNKGFGLGFQFGVPTGITGKYFLTENGDTALDFAVGNYYRRSRGGINFHADFLWHPFVLGKTDSMLVPFYLGIGARILDHGDDDRDRNGDHLHIGARAPIGIALDFTNVPIDIFLELALVVDLVSDDHAFTDFNAALGLRYYFN